MRPLNFCLAWCIYCILILCTSSFAQVPINSLARQLSPKSLKRVVKTLAADDMQGRALHTNAFATAKYLEKEFGRAGLKPLPGQTSLLQSFTLYQSRSTNLTARINDTLFKREQTVLLSGQSEFSWSNSTPHVLHVLHIGPQASLGKYVDSVFANKHDLLVLVHPKHAKWFTSLVTHYWQTHQYSRTPPKPYTTVLLLTTMSTPRSYQISGRTQLAPITACNVIGILPGQSPVHAAEQIIFSSHYDHLGFLPAVQGDSIANGADDDASGTAGVVALARYYSRQRNNARTLIFVAFTAEEVGGFGASYFADHLNPAKVIAMINIEMIGTPAKFGLGTAFITGFEKSSLGTILQRNLLNTNYHFEPDPYPEQYLFYRSDNYKLAQLGIPAHTLSTVQLPESKSYHSVNDEISLINFSNMSKILQAIILSTNKIITGQDTPTRISLKKP